MLETGSYHLHRCVLHCVYMSGRVRGRLAPPGLSLASAMYWRRSCWHALCCHCLSTEWNLRGVVAGVSVCVITQSSLSLSDV